MGCNEDAATDPEKVCIGYELTADLDFDTDGTADSGDAYWNSGAGWVPIGGSFTATFEGNGHVISNILIKNNSTGASHGLFGVLGSGGSIKRVGLDGGSVTSAGAGTHNTGGLVGGISGGTIEFSYSSAAVTTSGTGGEKLMAANSGTVTDINIGAVRLAIIEDRLNTMPRKLHDWNSAHSVYAALCRNDR